MTVVGGNLPCSAVILSGGRNSRMAGRNKAFLEVGGRPILDWIMHALTPIFSQILLVTRQPELYQGLGHRLEVIEDIFPGRSSLTGIHAGLVHSRASHALVVPCDAPFIQPKVLLSLIKHAEPDLDVIVPVSGDYYQPLCAIYSKRCVDPIEAQLQRKEYKIIQLFEKVNLKTIPVERFRSLDPELCSFFNVNTPEAHRQSQAMARHCRVPPAGHP